MTLIFKLKTVAYRFGILPKGYVLPAKDPMDWKLTENSGKWSTDQYCPKCKHWTTHEEKMSSLCNTCGHFGNMQKFQSWRNIWNGEKWVLQFKYGNEPTDYSIVE